MKFRFTFRVFVLVALLLSLLGSAVTVTPVYAASITVNTTDDELNNDGDCSLREAIQAANTDASVDNCVAGSGVDTITLAANTYQLTIPTTNEDANANGDLDITDADGLTIIGNNAIIQQTVTDRVFHVLSATVTFQDSTITGGNTFAGAGILSNTNSTVTLNHVEVSGNTSTGRGGGIYNNGGVLTIQNGSLIGKSGSPNTACTGGGVFTEGFPSATTTLDASTVSYNQSPNCAGGGFFLLYSAQLIIQNGSVVSNNIGGDPGPIPYPDISGGGGIYASASPTITISDSTVSNNTVNCAGNTGCGGGGLKGGSSVTITKSTFSNNTVNCNTSTECGGGGIYNTASLTATTSTFSDNDTGGYGGGIYTWSGTADIESSTFSNNSATFGGGSYTYYTGYTIIENSTLSGNNATTSGSAIAIFVGACAGGNVELRSTTIADGTSAGSAIYFDPFICVPGSLTMSNTIVERNGETNAFDFGGYSSSFDDNGNNITNDNEVNTPAGVAYHASLGLGTLINNGGSTETIALLTGSPAIDAGANCPSTDQRGVSRPNGTQCDIGAFEKIVTATFADVPTNAFAWANIESIYTFGITGGCSTSPLNYCPNQPVTRAQMAIFILRGIHGSAYAPPTATGTVFNDVPISHSAAAWIEQFYAEGITGGCGNGNFCPDQVETTRAQIAIFLLRAKYGSSYTPPAATGTMFTDIPSNAFAADWIEQFASEGITGGCGNGNYCPNSPVTRSQMAIFIQRTFNLPLP